MLQDKIERADVLASLRPGSGWHERANKDGSFELTWLDKNTSAPSEAEIETEMVRLQAEYDSIKWERDRRKDYPDWSVQLNKIYDDGVTKWKSEMIDPVKAKWPKDNSGPVE